MFTRARVADIAVAAALGSGAGAELAFAHPPAATVAAALAACGALVWRRTAPLAVLSVALLATVVGTWGDEQNASVFVVALAGYSLGAHTPPRRSATTLALVAIGLMAADVATGGEPSDGYFVLLMLGMPWLSGCLMRHYRERAQRLRVLAGQLERERDISAGLARARERHRLARDVHHAVAAAIGGVVEALDRAQRTDAAETRVALEAAQRTGRAAIGELQGVLGALRGSAVVQPAGPRPAVDPSARVRWPAWADLALGAVLAAMSLVSALTSGCYAGVRWAAAGLALAGLALAIRRAHPVAALAVGLAAGAAESRLIGTYGELPSPFIVQLLALYTLAARRPRDVAVAGLALAVAINVLVPLARGYLEAADLVLMLLFLGVPWLSGLAARRLRGQAAELRRLTARLAAERDARARLAIAEERARVARDLHDSSAHAVSVMVLQAGAAVEALELDLEVARAAIAAAASQRAAGPGGAAGAAGRPRRGRRRRRPRRARGGCPARWAAGAAARARGAAGGAGGGGGGDVPDRPGGIDQHAQARRTGGHDGHARIRARRTGRRGPRRRRRVRTRAGRRPWPRRDA